MTRRGTRLAFLGLIACSACTLITSGLDLEAASSAGPVADGGDVPDVAAPPDARRDATIDSPQPPGRYCAPGNTIFYCNDFDDPDLTKGWDSLSGAIGALSLVSDGATSPPNALALDFPVTDASVGGVYLEKTVNGAWTTLTCSVSYRRDVIGGSSSLLVFMDLLVETSLGTLGIKQHASLSDSPTEVGFDIPGNGGRNIVSAPINFEPGQFHRVGWEITRARVTVLVDDKRTVFTTHPVNSVPVRTRIQIGAPQSDLNEAPWRLRFDDLSCVAVP